MYQNSWWVRAGHYRIVNLQIAELEFTTIWYFLFNYMIKRCDTRFEHFHDVRMAKSAVVTEYDMILEFFDRAGTGLIGDLLQLFERTFKTIAAIYVHRLLLLPGKYNMRWCNARVKPADLDPCGIVY